MQRKILHAGADSGRGECLQHRGKYRSRFDGYGERSGGGGLRQHNRKMVSEVRTMKKLLWAVSIATGLSAAPANPDVKREQQYSDHLRKTQREYVQVMEEFDKWCSSHGQR